MKLSGTIKSFYDPTSGTSKNGNPFTKQDFVITLDGGGDYPDEILVTAFGDDRINALQHKGIGQHVEMFVDFRVNDYNGRGYNGANLWKFADAEPTQAQAPAPAEVPMSQASAEPEKLFDELPF